MSSLTRPAITTVLVIVVIASGVTGATAVSGTAIADDSHPLVPSSYYGEIEVNGEPAPVGTEITAEIDGEERGSIVVDELGHFGGPTFSDEKLTVEGDSADTGEVVSFFIDEQELEVNPEITWESGDLEEVSLVGDDISTPAFGVSINGDDSTAAVEPNETATIVADIENTGDAVGYTDVTFELEDEVVDTAHLELDAGETESVSFATLMQNEGEFDAFVDVGDDADGITILVGEDADDDDSPPSLPAPPEEPTPADVSVTEVALNTTAIDTHDSVDIKTILENTGEETGEATLELEVDGEAIDSQMATVKGESTATAIFTETFTQAGEYDISVNGEYAGTLTVSDSESPADISVTSATVSPDELEAGDEVTVEATLENTGESNGELTAQLLLDDEPITDETVNVAGETTETVTITTSIEVAGEYTIFINDFEAGSIAISQATDEVDDVVVDDAGDDGIPGFGLVFSLFVLLSTAFIVSRRR